MHDGIECWEGAQFRYLWLLKELAHFRLLFRLDFYFLVFRYGNRQLRLCSPKAKHMDGCLRGLKDSAMNQQRFEPLWAFRFQTLHPF